MLVLASASPRRRELLTQAGFSFVVHPAHICEDPFSGEDPIAYVTRLALEKAQAVFDEITKDRTGAPGPDFGTGEEMNSGRQSLTGAPGPVFGTGEEMISGHQSLAVLGADTTVFLDHHILGKPEDAADAARMLRLLSDRTHRVATGIALVSALTSQAVVEVTEVEFLPLTDTEIAAYIATGEPMDKAGAYAIQGLAARWIPRIQGCYFNVVGLPIARVAALLATLRQPSY
jgi:septum formation protein